MKVKSLYHFYKKYFYIPDSHNVPYARAIIDFMKVMRKVYEQKSYLPIKDYKESKYRRMLTLGFLDNFQKLVTKNYKEPFREIQYYNTEILILKRELKEKSIKDGLYIPIEFLIDIEKKEYIMLTFTKRYDINGEVGVIKGLFVNFYLKGILPSAIEKVTYWELSSGGEKSISYLDVVAADKARLIQAANRCIKDEKKK